VRATDRTAQDAPTLAELGVDKKRSARAKRLAALSPTDRHGYIETLKAAGKGVTPNAVLAASRKEKKTEKRKALMTAKCSADGPFDAVVIDPPWPVVKIDRDERPNQAEFPYPIMTIDELTDFWPQTIASYIADDAHMFCWATEKYLLTLKEVLLRCQRVCEDEPKGTERGTGGTGEFLPRPTGSEAQAGIPMAERVASSGGDTLRDHAAEHEAKTATAKAKASTTSRAAIDRATKLIREAPDLAYKVAMGELRGAWHHHCRHARREPGRGKKGISELKSVFPIWERKPLRCGYLLLPGIKFQN
jgi:hypothetical protein